MHSLLLIGTNPEEIMAALGALPGSPAVRLAANPREAQAVLPDLSPQPFAITIDSRGLDNLAACCQQARAFCPEGVALIVLAEAAGRSTAFAAGADDVFSFPLDTAELHIRLKHHFRYYQLIVERQKLHQRALENERLVTIGRLTASIVHSISNPLQAMRGALTLALEDSHNPRDVEEYVHLTQQELGRVANLVNRMRQLYRPQTDEISLIHLPDLLRDTFETAQEEAMRQKVRLRDQLTLDVPAIRGAASQLQLAFLSLVLTLIDIIGEAGGGELAVSASGIKNNIRVDFAIPTRTNFQVEETDDYTTELRYGLAPMLDLITANRGSFHFVEQNDHTIWRIEFGA